MCPLGPYNIGLFLEGASIKSLINQPIKKRQCPTEGRRFKNCLYCRQDKPASSNLQLYYLVC